MRYAESAGAVILALALLATPLHGQEAETPEGSGQQTPSFPPIAYVNTQVVMQNAPGVDSAQAQFNQTLDQYRQEVERLQTVVDSLTQAYQRQEGTLTPEARQARQDEILQKRQELQQRAQQLEQQASQRQQELLQPILEKVQGVIEEIRSERGYAVVFDVSGPGVVAADPDLNITEEVLSRLETQAGADTTGDAGPSPGGEGR